MIRTIWFLYSHRYIRITSLPLSCTALLQWVTFPFTIPVFVAEIASLPFANPTSTISPFVVAFGAIVLAIARLYFSVLLECYHQSSFVNRGKLYFFLLQIFFHFRSDFLSFLDFGVMSRTNDNLQPGFSLFLGLFMVITIKPFC